MLVKGRQGLQSFPPPTRPARSYKDCASIWAGMDPKHPDQWPPELGDSNNLGSLELRGPLFVGKVNFYIRLP